jgi:RNA polymerase sigma factor (sigma-70 family)
MQRVTEATPTVVVIDDDDAVRGSLKLLLKSINIPVTVYASAQEFLPSYVLDQPGCLIVDVRMPGLNGLELQQKLNLRGAMIPVIFISGHGDISMAVEAMQHGAFDFLPKPFSDQDLLDRVQRALQKDADNRRQVARSDHIRECLELLTPREREVLALIVIGKPNKVMASDLGVSQRTVEIHRARVMEKMQSGSVAQLVRMTLAIEDAAKGGLAAQVSAVQTRNKNGDTSQDSAT